MSMRDLIAKLDMLTEAANPAQQAAIAVNMKKHHQKPKTEGSMDSSEHKPTGPKFPGYWKGTDSASQAKNKMVGGSAEESIIKDLERALVENPRTNKHSLMREWAAFKESADEYVLYVNGKPAAKYHDVHQAEQDIAILKQRVPSAKVEIKQEVCKMVPVGISESMVNALVSEEFKSKQEVIAHFVKQGKSAAAGAAAWERGYRGPSKPAFKPKQPAPGQKFWWQDRDLDEDEIGAYQPEPGAANQGDTHTPSPIGSGTNEDLNEYGGVGGYGAASQAPQGSTNQTPDPAVQQQKMDQQQIVKNTNQVAQSLNQQGAAQSLNKVKFSDTMTKLDATPNTDLSSQELKQMEPLAVATSKALQNPQTTTQMKQLINKATTLDAAKDQKVKQQQQQVGTNQPANMQMSQTANNQAQQNQSAGQTK